MTYFTPESRLVALLCVPLPAGGLINQTPTGLWQGETTRPLSPKQWFIFNERLTSAGGHDGGSQPVACPPDSFDLNNIEQADVSVLAKVLNLPESDAIQIRKRLDSVEVVEIELDRLQELGIWMVTIADPDYPNRLRENLPIQAPPVLFGVGDPKALDRGGLAVVGPRNSNDSDLFFAKEIGELCAKEGIQVISGAAKGIDRYAMTGAMEAGGQVVGVLGDSLEKHAKDPDMQQLVSSGQLTLVTCYHPKSHFEVGKAMGRNKLIYALADWALVVSCQVGQGGTWHGATSALKSLNIPVFVRTDTDLSPGNLELLKRGALEFPQLPWKNLVESLTVLSENYRPKKSIPNDQVGLFDDEE